MKRIIAFFLCVLTLAAILTAAPLAGDVKPEGYWPALSAYNKAVKAGDEAEIMSTGAALEKICRSVKIDNDMANQLYMIYLKRMQLKIYENKRDYNSAVDNAAKLLEMSRYLTAHGIDRTDMITACQAHIRAVTPTYGVYAASYTQKASYNSKLASVSGTLYGALCYSETMARKGITSFYVELEKQSARDFAPTISPFDDGTRVLQINLNFRDEGDGAREIPKGTYDEMIVDSFRYIAELNSPVLVRIGAEMNVWTKTVSPGDFKKAYDHVAAIARREAPEAELVWSPNFVSAWNVNVEDFYPSDEYVDWVGVSLYYTYKPSSNTDTWVEYAHNLGFADPIICAEEIVKIAEKHGKPVAVTEGGTVRTAENDGTGEAWAAKKVAKEYSTLNMVFPRVKTIVHFDCVHNGRDYTISGEVGVQTNAAIAANPALKESVDAAAAEWIPAGRFNESAPETLLLGAAGHTYASADMSAVYKLDGKQIAAPKSAPNYCRIDPSTLAEGAHELLVTLSDGAGYSVKIKYVLTAAKGNIAILPAGDVNGDGKINARDVTLMMKAIAGGTPLDMLVADVNADGKLNARDVTSLMKTIVAG